MHSSPKIDQLKMQHNIEFIYLPHHSSHLTQLLDCVLFNCFKKMTKKIKSPSNLTDHSARIYIGVNAIFSVSNFNNIFSSFSKAGIYSDIGKNKLDVDYTEVLSNSSLIQSSISTTEFSILIQQKKLEFVKQQLDTNILQEIDPNSSSNFPYEKIPFNNILQIRNLNNITKGRKKLTSFSKTIKKEEKEEKEKRKRRKK